MVVLRDDLFIRGQIARRHFAISGLHCALIFLAAALLVLARLDHPLARNLQHSLDNWGARPIAWARDVIAPTAVIWERARLAFTGDIEIAYLRQENLRLRTIENRIVLDDVRMQELQNLAKMVNKTQPEPLFTARVLAGSNGYFGHSLLIDAGGRNGVREGYAVHSAVGLIGRIAGVTDDTARVLLLSDVESRIPVSIGSKMHRAILVGAGNEAARLLLSHENASIKNGDQVVTSGAGGMLRAGLLIGRVSIGEDGAGVHLVALSERLRYVAIEQYAGPAARLTDFLSARALERNLEKNATAHCQASPAGSQRLEPFAGARLDLEEVQR